MRQFGVPVGPEVRQRIMALAEAIYARAEPKRPVRGQDFAMEEAPDRVVLHEVDIRWGHDRLRIAVTEPDARPPFEWLIEITANVGETDYFKHYLVRDHDVVLAQRKVLTPLDAAEAEIVLADLQAADRSF